MPHILVKILDWSEVWALLIPLVVLLKRKNQRAYLVPVIAYIWIALPLNIFQDIIADFRQVYSFPSWLQTNNYVYNIQSIARLICFAFFFVRLNQSFLDKYKIPFYLICLLIIVVDFIFFEDFFRVKSFSSFLLAFESAILLFHCLQFYLFKLQEEDNNWNQKPDFWVVTGLSIYVTFNFFYFLFYTTLIENGHTQFVMSMWYLHNVTYIILCIFIAKAFYAARLQ